MAYDWYIGTAFNRGEETPNGYSYVSVEEALSNLTDMAVSRVYVDEDGNFTYESRSMRSA